jgi:tetratricopeptide (TPR) repeat protein
MTEHNKIDLPPWRTFSIFISSTFADMQAERDHLKNVVFPRVEEELQKRRINLELVDLRWGVDTTSIAQEDEREANVLKVCLDEIKRCRPFFVGLLGDRYGWVPPLERMKTALVGEKHIVPEKGKSVTELEMEFGVLASQEQLLRSVFYFRDPLPYEIFSNKRAAMFSDGYNDELSDAEKRERKTALEKLKTDIRNHFDRLKQGNKVKTYSGIWNAEKEKLTGLETWGETVYTDILAECESHAKNTWEKVPQNWQEQEVARLDAFIENNTSTFCGRKQLLEALKHHLLSGNTLNWGIVLTGESGSGKSAVFSMVNKMMQKEDCFILAHSAGLSPLAKSVASLLQIWNMQLADFLGMKEEMIGERRIADELTSRITGEPGKELIFTIEKLQEKFLELLQLAAAKKRVVLLIDALDRFEPTARAQHLSWLPTVMPINVRLLLTAITGIEQKAVTYHKGLIQRNIDVFSSEEAGEMLLALCKRQHKIFPKKIENIILDKIRDDGQPATSSPLWLSLAVNMLMALDQDDFEKISHFEGRGDQQIEIYITEMANGFDPLPGPLFMSLKSKAGLLFGETFTEAIFDYIAISRNGLREKDLAMILPEDSIEWDSLRFASLRRWSKSYLILQGADLQWNLAHSILKNALLDKIPETGSKDLHLNFANYLLSLPDADTLKISETMYHLMKADELETAANFYSNFLYNTPQTEGSSKVLAEALILNEAHNETDSLNRILSLLAFVDSDDNKLGVLLPNFIFSLFDKHLQSDTAVSTRIKIILVVSEKIAELRRRAPASADYARALSISYDKLGDLYLLLGDHSNALDKYRDSLTIAEELHNRAPDSAEYARDLMISFEKNGTFATKIGDISKAKDNFEKAFYLSKELHKRAPDSAQYSQDLSRYYYMLGDMYFQLADYPKALDKYQTSLTIREELLVRAPDSADYARDLMISYERNGRFLTTIGDLSKAKENVEKAFNLSNELHKRAPDSALYSLDLSRYYSMLGDLYFLSGEHAKALDKFQDCLTIAEELLRRAPDSADYARYISVSCSKLGDIYLRLGDTEKALDKYQACLTIAEGLRRRAPDSADYTRDLSATHNKLGDLYLQLGDTAKALEKYQTSLTLAEELQCRAPESADYTRDLSISNERLGDLYLKLGDPQKALDKYQASRTIEEELCRRAPDSVDYTRALSVTYSKLGDLYLQLGDPEKALNEYQASLAIDEELCRRVPDSADYASDVYVSYVNLGDLYLKLGDPAKALENYQASLIIAEELRRKVPDSTNYAHDLTLLYSQLGDLYLQSGELVKALEKYQACRTIAEELYRRESDSEVYASTLNKSYKNLGNLHHKLDEPVKALEKYQASLTISEELWRRKPDSEDYAYEVYVSYVKLGDLYLQLGEPAKTLENFQASHSIAKELRRRSPDSADYARALSFSYERLGELYLRLGDLEKALVEYQASRTIREELCRWEPSSANYARDLTFSYEKLGDLYLKLGEHPKALDQYQAFLTIADELHHNEPDSSEYSCDLSECYKKLGNLYLQMGNLPKALDKYQASLTITEELTRSVPESVEYAHDLYMSYRYLAEINEKMGNNSSKKWWKKSFQTLNNLKLAGIFISIEEEEDLEFLRTKSES